MVAETDRVGVTRRAALGMATGASVGALAASTPAAGTAPTASRNPIVELDAAALAAAIHARRVSCVEVMEAYLDHIERLNPRVNAIVALEDHAKLLREALERDDQLARGESLGVMHGFPHAVKDLQPVKGMRTTMGARVLKDFVASADSILVERMRAAGAIFIGKTNAPEFGLGSHTYNAVYGLTRNAYRLDRSAGGSSGGAAVALALRMVPLADGSDFGGSLRNPAGWNAVCGFRTSIGRIPSERVDAWMPSMGVPGPMARNVSDLALLLAVQTGFDARDPFSLEGDGLPYLQRFERSFKGKRIAWAGDFRGHTPCESGLLEVCGRALRVFESLGCNVEEAVPDLDPEPVWQALVRLRGWMQGSSMLKYYNDLTTRGLLKPESVYEVETGLRQSAADLTTASTVRTAWSRAVQRLFERYDYLIVPTAQVFPFAAELDWPKSIAGVAMRSYHEWMKAQLLVTMSGCPALAVPAGFGPEGLPIGIQIIAPIRRELACLQLAYAYESAMDPDWRRAPELLASG
jgi:amidase